MAQGKENDDYASPTERSSQAQEAALRVRGLKMSLAGQGVASSFSFGADHLLRALQHLALSLN